MKQQEKKEYNSKVIKWIINYFGGLIKTEKQATYVVVVFFVLAIVFSLFLVFKSQPRASLPLDERMIPPNIRLKNLPR